MDALRDFAPQHAATGFSALRSDSGVRTLGHHLGGLVVTLSFSVERSSVHHGCGQIRDKLELWRAWRLRRCLRLHSAWRSSRDSYARAPGPRLHRMRPPLEPGSHAVHVGCEGRQTGPRLLYRGCEPFALRPQYLLRRLRTPSADSCLHTPILRSPREVSCDPRARLGLGVHENVSPPLGRAARAPSLIASVGRASHTSPVS